MLSHEHNQHNVTLDCCCCCRRRCRRSGCRFLLGSRQRQPKLSHLTHARAECKLNASESQVKLNRSEAGQAAGRLVGLVHASRCCCCCCCCCLLLLSIATTIAIAAIAIAAHLTLQSGRRSHQRVGKLDSCARESPVVGLRFHLCRSLATSLPPARVSLALRLCGALSAVRCVTLRCAARCVCVCVSLSLCVFWLASSLSRVNCNHRRPRVRLRLRAAATATTTATTSLNCAISFSYACMQLQLQSPNRFNQQQQRRLNSSPLFMRPSPHSSDGLSKKNACHSLSWQHRGPRGLELVSLRWLVSNVRPVV